MKKKGISVANNSSVKSFAKGGTFRSSADGIATKGKTKAKQVCMAKGGKV